MTSNRVLDLANFFYNQLYNNESMGLRNFFFGTSDDYKCEHLIKYDGRSIAIEGVSYGNIQVGKVGIERKLVQAASHALMLLDASQYSLCTSIKNINNKEERDSLTRLMIEDKVRSEKIIQTLAALSIDPQSKQLQDTLGTLIISYSERASKIEETQPKVSPTEKQLSINSLEIGAETIVERVKDLERSSPELKKQVIDESTDGMREKSTVQPTKSEEGLDELGNALIALRKEYTDVIMHKQSVSDLFQKLAPYLQQITSDSEIKDLIGKYYADALNNYLINLSNEIESYDNAMQLGGEQRKYAADEAERKIKLVTYHVLAKLDEIHSYLKRKS
jgi:hypothetical protein